MSDMADIRRMVDAVWTDASRHAVPVDDASSHALLRSLVAAVEALASRRPGTPDLSPLLVLLREELAKLAARDGGPVMLAAESVEALRHQTVTLDDASVKALTNIVGQQGTSTMIGGGGGNKSLLEDIKRAVTDFETRMDYDASNNLVYSGKAKQGTATSAATWIVQKLEYTSGNLTRVQVLTGAWDDRAALGWT